MANMEYCRFENTYYDLEECYNDLSEKGVAALQQRVDAHERRYIKKLIELCRWIADDFEDEL